MALMRVGFEAQTFDYDPDTLLMSELRAVKSVTGWNRNDWYAAIDAREADAICALVWILRKRAGEADLRFTDVDGAYESFTLVNVAAPKRVGKEKLSPPVAVA